MTELDCWGELTINGEVYLRARDYDPKTGTFTKRDPLPGLRGTTTVANPYHYVNNDPLNKKDPSGKRPTDDGALRGGVLPQPACGSGVAGDCYFVAGSTVGSFGGGDGELADGGNVQQIVCKIHTDRPRIKKIAR